MKSIVGQRFGRWRVTAFAGYKGTNSAHWHCVCDCGVRKEVAASSLKSKRSTSCGCFCRENAVIYGRSRRTHGLGLTVEYQVWCNMVMRCRPNYKQHADYYDRGIHVCEAWVKDPAAFVAHIGLRPDASLSLDRIDNNKGYEPGNVRWATRVQQNRNRRRPRTGLKRNRKKKIKTT